MNLDYEVEPGREADYLIDPENPSQALNSWEFEYEGIVSPLLEELLGPYPRLLKVQNKIVTYRIKHFQEIYDRYNRGEEIAPEGIFSAFAPGRGDFLSRYIQALPKNHYLQKCLLKSSTLNQEAIVGETHGSNYVEEALFRLKDLPMYKLFSCRPDYDLGLIDSSITTYDEEDMKNLLEKVNNLPKERYLEDHSATFSSYNGQLLARVETFYDNHPEFRTAIFKMLVKNFYGGFDSFTAFYDDPRTVEAKFVTPPYEPIQRYLIDDQGNKTPLGPLEIPSFFLPSSFTLVKKGTAEKITFLNNRPVK